MLQVIWGIAYVLSSSSYIQLGRVRGGEGGRKGWGGERRGEGGGGRGVQLVVTTKGVEADGS